MPTEHATYGHRIEALEVENERLRNAVTKAENILARNLGHQTEKCYDALAILRRAIQES